MATAGSIVKTGSMMGKNMRQEIQDDLQAQFEHDQVGSRHKFISANGKYIYHLGIIDYLGDYLSKKLETQAKVPFYGMGISAIPAQPYAVRFVKFMEEEVIIDQMAMKGTASNNSA